MIFAIGMRSKDGWSFVCPKVPSRAILVCNDLLSLRKSIEQLKEDNTYIDGSPFKEEPQFCFLFYNRISDIWELMD